MVASSCPAGSAAGLLRAGAVPRQQLGDAVDGVGRDPLEDVAEIGFGLHAVEPSGRDQGGDRRSARTTRSILRTEPFCDGVQPPCTPSAVAMCSLPVPAVVRQKGWLVRDR